MLIVRHSSSIEHCDRPTINCRNVSFIESSKDIPFKLTMLLSTSMVGDTEIVGTKYDITTISKSPYYSLTDPQWMNQWMVMLFSTDGGIRNILSTLYEGGHNCAIGYTVLLTGVEFSILTNADADTVTLLSL